MRSRSPRQPNSRLKKVSRICSCPRAPLGRHPLSRFHGIPARGVTSTGGASSNVPTGCDGSPVKRSASPQRAPTPSSTLRADASGSCRLRRTSCCKAVKGANNLNKEPSAAQKMIGDFAPKLVELTDDVLFGDVWAREEFSPRDRSLVTVAALIAGGNTEQLPNYLNRARENGLSETELVEIITNPAFYSGWPRLMSAIRVAKEIFKK